MTFAAAAACFQADSVAHEAADPPLIPPLQGREKQVERTSARGRGWVFSVVAMLVLSLAGSAGAADLPSILRRGVNLTNWFRFPADRSPAALRSYAGDRALAGIRAAGFTFVRLAVDPDLLLQADGTADAVRIGLVAEAAARIEAQGLAVVIGLHPRGWHLERSAADRTRLLETWRTLALALVRLAARQTFPEVLNEPVFSNDPAAWGVLQARAVAVIRATLPTNGIVVSGNDWGSVAGLLRLRPLAGPGLIYSFHFYDPPILTTLGAFRTDLDQTVLTMLPFPVRDGQPCGVSSSTGFTADAARFYCGERWDEARIRGRIAAAGDWGRRNGVAVLAGEFGARDRLNPAARLAWLASVRAACEAEGVGWALWGYDDSFGLNVKRPPGEGGQLAPDVLTALGLQTGSWGAASPR